MTRCALDTGARTQVSNRADADPARAPTYRGAGVVRTAGQDHCAPAHRDEGDRLEGIDPADPQQAAACRSLWAAVALAALADAELDPLGPAAAYLRTADFRAVLSLADLDADAALQRLDRMRCDRLEAARQRQEAELTNRRPGAYADRHQQPRAKRASKGTTR